MSVVQQIYTYIFAGIALRISIASLTSADGDYDWIQKIAAEGGVHHLEARTYFIDKQYQLLPNTEIHGVGSDKNSGTIIQAVATTSYDEICWDSVKNRKGFLLGDNNYIGKIYFSGIDTKRYRDNQLLCGGAPFETPGCAGAGKYAVPPESCGGDLGRGEGVTNVTVEDVTIEAYTVQSAFFAAPTRLGVNVSQDITIRSLRCDGTWADGMNFHGGHKNILVEDSVIRNSGDDAYAIWSIGSLEDNITFRNNIAQNPRYRPGGSDDKNPSQQQYCFAVYGGLTSSFVGNNCTESSEPVAYGNCKYGLFGGEFTTESHSVVQGMEGDFSGKTCYRCQSNSIPEQNLICDARPSPAPTPPSLCSSIQWGTCTPSPWTGSCLDHLDYSIKTEGKSCADAVQSIQGQCGACSVCTEADCSQETLERSTNLQFLSKSSSVLP